MDVDSMKKLQYSLIYLNNEGLELLVQHLVISEWLDNEESQKDFLSIVLDISNYRPHQSSLYADLCCQLCNLNETFKQVLSDQMRTDLFTNPTIKATFPAHFFFYDSVFKHHRSLLDFDPIDELKSGITPSYGLGIFQMFKEIPNYLESMIINDMHKLNRFYETNDQILENITITHPLFMPTRFCFNEKLLESIANDDLDSFIEEFDYASPQYDKEIGIISHLWDEFRFIHLHRLGNNNKEDFVRSCDLSALFGSIKIFKFLCSNGVDISKSLTFAIIGGNIEIIRLIIQQGIILTNVHAEIAYKSYQNDVLSWILQTVRLVDLNPVLSNNVYCIEYFKVDFNNETMDEIIKRRYVYLKSWIDDRNRIKIENRLKNEKCFCFITDRAYFICYLQNQLFVDNCRVISEPLSTQCSPEQTININDYTWICQGRKVRVDEKMFDKIGSIFCGKKSYAYRRPHFIGRLT